MDAGVFLGLQNRRAAGNRRRCVRLAHASAKAKLSRFVIRLSSEQPPGTGGREPGRAVL
jgi:hypothetical protein